jgi:hypothetical protein
VRYEVSPPAQATRATTHPMMQPHLPHSVHLSPKQPCTYTPAPPPCLCPCLFLCLCHCLCSDAPTCGRVVRHSHKVEEGADHKERPQEQEVCQHQRPHPTLPVHLNITHTYTHTHIPTGTGAVIRVGTDDIITIDILYMCTH